MNRRNRLVGARLPRRPACADPRGPVDGRLESRQASSTDPKANARAREPPWRGLQPGRRLRLVCRGRAGAPERREDLKRPPDRFRIVQGSCSRAELKLCASNPRAGSSCFTRMSRAIVAGSYRRFQKTASRRARWRVAQGIEARTGSHDGQSRTQPRRDVSSAASEWCSHQREAAPGAQPPSSSGAQT